MFSHTTDGAKLRTNDHKDTIFVSGALEDDKLKATHLTILMPLVAMETGVTYGCQISYDTSIGDMKTFTQKLNFTNTCKLYICVLTRIIIDEM